MAFRREVGCSGRDQKSDAERTHDYITTDQCPNPASALDGYIGAMQEWVDAAKGGGSVEKLIPVNVDATPEHAKELESRLHFLQDEILSAYVDNLKESAFPGRSAWWQIFV